jgi:hypothetical protein
LQIHKCGNWETEHYISVLEIMRTHSFISGNPYIGTRHLYWILIGPSFAVYRTYQKGNDTAGQGIGFSRAGNRIHQDSSTAVKVYRA